MAKIWFHWCLKFMLVCIFSKHNVSCAGGKLERKQDFFDMDPFDNKRDYGLSQIGKRGFTSSLGFDYSGSSEYGIGGTSDYTTVRSSGSGETISPARDLIPPPAPGLFSSSKSPLSTRSDYGGRFASPSSTKDFLSSSHRRRSQISRRSPHLQQTSLNNYFDDIITSSTTPGSRGRSLSSGTFGLVANNDGKLIGYRGSIFPGAFHSESPPSSSVTSTSSLASDSSNFVGGYFPGPPSSMSTDYPRPSKYSLASSATSGSYTSTPVYYPGREEDHTYRIRDTTSQGYEDEESNPSLDESDFNIGSNSYQSSPLSSPPGSHYHSRESDELSSRHYDGSRFTTYSHNDLPGAGFSYGPLGKGHPSTYKAFNTKKAFSSSNYGSRGERVIPYSYTPLSYNDYGSA